MLSDHTHTIFFLIYIPTSTKQKTVYDKNSMSLDVNSTMFSRIREHFTYNDDQNVVDLFKPVYVLLSIAGLFPYAIRFPKGKHDCKIRRESLLFHSLGGVSTCAYVCTFFALQFKNSTKSPEGALTDINFIIELFLVLICCLSAYLCAIWYRKVYVRILSRIAFIWTDLSKEPSPDVKPTLTYLRKLLIVPIIVGLIIVIPVQIVLCVIGDITVWKQLLPEAVPTLVVVFYSAMVLMVIGLIKIINNHCQSLGGTNHRNTDLNIVRSKHWKESDWIFLNRLELAYVNALDVKQEINKAFQAPISIIIVQCFHTILCEAHTLYHELIITRYFNLFSVIDRSYWMLYSLVKIYVLSFTGSLLQDEVVQIGQSLHSLPIEKQDVNLLMEIQHFSTLIYFHGADISIYGFFTLDSTLLFNMVASLATYLIILVQFDV